MLETPGSSSARGPRSSANSSRVRRASPGRRAIGEVQRASQIFRFFAGEALGSRASTSGACVRASTSTCSASRSAWSASSPRGTSRSRSPRGRSRRPWRTAAPWSSSRPRSCPRAPGRSSRARARRRARRGAQSGGRSGQRRRGTRSCTTRACAASASRAPRPSARRRGRPGRSVRPVAARDGREEPARRSSTTPTLTSRSIARSRARSSRRGSGAPRAAGSSSPPGSTTASSWRRSHGCASFGSATRSLPTRRSVRWSRGAARSRTSTIWQIGARKAPTWRSAGERSSARPTATTSNRRCWSLPRNDMRINREEIFGPVASVVRAEDPGRGARACERHGVRPVRRRMHDVAQARRAVPRRAPGGHRHDQPPDRRRGLPRPVRRHQGLLERHPGAGPLCGRVLHHGQDRVHQALIARGLVHRPDEV